MANGAAGSPGVRGGTARGRTSAPARCRADPPPGNGPGGGVMSRAIPVGLGGFDLLRSWRLERGLPQPVPLNRPRLLRQGTLIAATCVGLVAVPAALLEVDSGQREVRLAQLKTVADRSDILQQQVQQHQQQRDRLDRQSKALASALGSVRSSSALLRELAERTPAGVQLQELAMMAGSLRLEAQASSFEQADLLQLSLRRSPFLQPGPQGVRLKQVSHGDGGEAGPATVVFTLEADFRPRLSGTARQQLARLGADGLARRLAQLRRLELLP
ncbi:MAG: hypothetical protein ERJ67_01885 [Aphanocapsa feldmannii 277cV]|uniref:Pilus assembly protein n=1 Tax=Aphanocapsa feldmannii 277cV TaxID=2507553 RepID=A0A524RQF0_9CHRO|nr:MAG: hypothetical protein ERJ67_01885 [Aphanocapsa feldmannii 277cV]